MADPNRIDLYDLLPALHRIRDEEIASTITGKPVGDPGLKGPLRELLELIEAQAELIRENIGDLYDDFFIETCAEWVIPYIGDLIGNIPIHEVLRTRRTDVARTLYYRRRKGTRAVIEELARDVTGWAAHAVPFFEHLQWTQNVNHVRLERTKDLLERRPSTFDRVGTVQVRDLDLLDRLNGPFDSLAHTLDVRPIARDRGRHGARKVGVFLWRLKSFLMENVPARRTTNGAAQEYCINPLGGPVRLFQHPEDLPSGEPTTEAHVPAPIRKVRFFQDPALFYAPNAGLRIRHDKADPVPVAQILCMDLSGWDTPPGGKVGVDVVLGRVSFSSGTGPTDPDSVRITYNYGFSAQIGGGSYDRLAPAFVLERPDESLEWRAWHPDLGPEVELETFPVGEGETHKTISAAVGAWIHEGRPRAAICITDNSTYAETISIELASKELIVRAENGKRPLISGDLAVHGSRGGGSLVLSGLMIAGTIRVQEDMENLVISHCTLVPGRTLQEDGSPAEPDEPSIVSVSNAVHLRVQIERSIVGRLELPPTLVSLSVKDSIIDGANREGRPPRPALAGDLTGDTPAVASTILRTTVLGKVVVRELILASESIFTDTLLSKRKQSGCMRFCHVPAGSETPRRYRCQPDMAMDGVEDDEKERVAVRVSPEITSIRFGDPDYCRLSLDCAVEIAKGAEDGGEMGVYNLLRNPQREANLRIRLDEYLPFGLEAGLILVS